MSKFKHIEGIGKPLKVVSPDTEEENLKNKHEHKVIETFSYNDKRGWRFEIEDDWGYVIYCTEKNCLHLKGKNWIVTERE